MSQNEFTAVMNDASRLLDDDRPSEALERLVAFDDGLTDPLSPQEYGWVFFYRFRAAFLAGDMAQALHLAEHGPSRFAADVLPTNAGWMMSAAMEAASELGLPDKVVSMADRCIELRRGDEDRESVLMAASTACTLLKQLSRHDLESRFAQILIDEGDGFDDYRMYGYHELCLVIDATGETELMDKLLDGRDWLADRDHEFAQAALRYMRAPAVMARRDERSSLPGN